MLYQNLIKEKWSKIKLECFIIFPTKIKTWKYLSQELKKYAETVQKWK